MLECTKDNVSLASSKEDVNNKHNLLRLAVQAWHTWHCALTRIPAYHTHTYTLVQGPPYKNSLKFLVGKYLNREMDRKEGHCSVDDATAVMDLVNLKLARGQ
jgi:hypothetical protein